MPRSPLMERDAQIGRLREALTEAARGPGQIVLVSGEAGIGKSSLVAHVLEQAAGARALIGSCEALFTPRPLGPLHDIAAQIAGDLRAALAAAEDRATAFTALLDLLQQPAQTAILVLEDVHWADEATLDLIRYIGRRIQRTRCLLILTYREHELSPQHPLRATLSELPHALVARIVLPPLSPVAVAALAQRAGRSARDLHAITGGNPFFVTEVLASDGAGVPGSVRDAVLSRATRLGQAAYSVLELVSVVPARAELWLVEAVLAPDPAALDACTGSGMLTLAHGALAFRHDLARRAVEATLPASRRRALHAAVLGALRGATWPADLARLAHHAEGAENAEQVLALLPAAAGQAAALGAHREAARHYRTALTYADALSHEERAVLLEGLAYESYLTGQIAEAHEARSAALLLWRQLGRREQEGATLRWLSRLSWFLARRDDAYRYAAEAIALLEQLPPGEELAMAYTNRSQIHMLSYETGEAVAWGERALALATALDAAAIRAHALNNIGTAIFYEDGARGLALLGESLRLALEYGLEEHVARAYTNLGSGGVVARDYGAAMAALEEGIAYCIERDLDSWELYMRAWRARARLETGDWDGAVEEARAILSRPQAPAVSRIPALAALGRTLARRGDAAAGPALDEARELAAQTGELQRIAPVAVARAEACWLRGAAEGCRAELRPALALADDGTNHWERGELQLWLWRAGAGAGQPDLPDVISREIAGDWRGAARAWEQLGCPYERALALAAGDAEALRLAQGLLGQLGAAPALAIVQRRMRDRGLSGIPRGPRQSTQANPAQLTQRQIEVLRLVADGLQNGAIAERLHITAKTVDHHLAAIFAKLAVRSRAQAVAAAARLGLLAES